MDKKDKLYYKSRKQFTSLIEYGVEELLNPTIYNDIIDSSETFQNLMLLFSFLNPDWIIDYNNVEIQKPKEIQTPLKGKSQSLTKDIIDSVKGSGRLIEMAMSIHIANKIAHELENIRDNIMLYYIPKDINNLKDINRKKLFKYVQEYFECEKRKDIKKSRMQEIIKVLNKFGLTENVLKNITDNDKKRIIILNKLRENAFVIKDSLIYSLITDLNHDREVEDENDLILDSRPSYGMYSSVKKDRYGDPMYQTNGELLMENVLIIDVPFFGQFCVHLLHKNTISALSQTPYNAIQRFHETKSVILTDDMSSAGNFVLKQMRSEGILEFLDMNNTELLNRLRLMRKQNPRFAHYLALKLGADRDVIDYIYSDDTDNSKDNDEGEREE